MILMVTGSALIVAIIVGVVISRRRNSRYKNILQITQIFLLKFQSLKHILKSTRLLFKAIRCKIENDIMASHEMYCPFFLYYLLLNAFQVHPPTAGEQDWSHQGRLHRG